MASKIQTERLKTINPLEDRCKESYIYTIVFQGAYFGRDDIAYRGAAKFFMKSSEEEREHATKFIEYLNKRGGKPHFKQLHVRRCLSLHSFIIIN